ncbi:unnamed protein product [Effrenium voratum]|nr:unnamed protein product [Effrenium voratum]
MVCSKISKALSETNPKKCAAGWGIATCVFFLVGAIVLPVGLLSLEAPESYVSLGTCKISAVNHKPEMCPGYDRKSKCFDIHTYQFEYEGMTLLSKEDRTACRSGVCNAIAGHEHGGQATPRFNVGEDVPCWRVTQSRERFSCGNDDCIKIFDPAQEIAEGASGIIGVGAAFLSLGLCSGCLVVVNVLRIRSKVKSEPDHENNEPGHENNNKGVES